MQTADVRPSVLVAEDEILISLDLCGVLVEAGYQIIGPADTLQGALFLLERHSPQLAIIDLLLRDGSGTLLAHQLHKRGVPFLVHSGCAREDDLVALCHDAPWVAKPFAPDHLLSTLEALLPQTVSA